MYSQRSYETSTRKKISTRENTHEKKFGPTKYPLEKISDPRNTHEKKLRTHETHDSTRPTEFSTLDLKSPEAVVRRCSSK